MNKDFLTKGFGLFNSQSVLERNKKNLANLCTLLGINGEIDFATIESGLAEIFRENPEKYTGLLKAFSNTPDFISYAIDNQVLGFVRDCGIAFPTLVTPPILHVVSDKLIINKNKVFTPPHQDVVSTKGSVGQVVVWIPLHEIIPNNFGIQAWPGTHLNGQLPSEYSDFGHTVKSDLIPNEQPKYISMQNGDICIFSQYLIHETYKYGKFRMAASFRFNDALDNNWAERKYFVPFGRNEDKSEYEDSRHLAPTDVHDYFKCTD